SLLDDRSSQSLDLRTADVVAASLLADRNEKVRLREGAQVPTGNLVGQFVGMHGAVGGISNPEADRRVIERVDGSLRKSRVGDDSLQVLPKALAFLDALQPGARLPQMWRDDETHPRARMPLGLPGASAGRGA